MEFLAFMMIKPKRPSSAYLLLSILFLCLLFHKPAFADTKPYIVYLGEHSHPSKEAALLAEQRVIDSHHQLLGSFLKSEVKVGNSIFYSYTKSINGFAANLEEGEAKAISKHPSVVSVFPSRGYKLHTTRSWEFMGLEKNDGAVPDTSLWEAARYGEDTIIANLDTGVWPESESFKDEGMGPVPSKWKGICQEGVACNRKLIGARFFNKGFLAYSGPQNATYTTARDTDGHGTHTLSTAGGGFVANASVYGYGNGTAKGGSPKARVAAYKVCWPPVNESDGECFDADIMAAFDSAIHDGVDVISGSIGGASAGYFQDGIAIASFHAVKNGITVVMSAGNDGPKAGSVSNTAPWLITVGASTMDREFPSYIEFNGTKIKGQSLSETGLSHKKIYPMISSIDAKLSNASSAELCFMNSLDPKKVKGKIVVCLRGITARVEKGEVVRLAGGAGMVLANNKASGNEIIADAHVLPATHITYSDGLTLFSYLNCTKSPVGYITLPKTKLDTRPAPFMAAFSSQGPNTINPEIIKPDITAPGVSVIAAFSKAASPTNLAFDKRRVAYNSVSGTSMSCPHISGVVGLLRTLHPDWSPSMIKSAIMTTARTRDNMAEPMTNASFVKATPFSYGSGHVRPNAAMYPGLVYELTTKDYIDFLCANGYNTTQIASFSPSYSCPANPPKMEDLNYPSISVPNLSGCSVTVKRRLKNVGFPGTYTVRVKKPAGVSVSVNPTSLRFDRVGEEKKYEVTLKIEGKNAAKDYVFGGLIWSDGEHYVRTPIAVKSRD